MLTKPFRWVFYWIQLGLGLARAPVIMLPIPHDSPQEHNLFTNLAVFPLLYGFVQS